MPKIHKFTNSARHITAGRPVCQYVIVMGCCGRRLRPHRHGWLPTSRTHAGAPCDARRGRARGSCQRSRAAAAGSGRAGGSRTSAARCTALQRARAVRPAGCGRLGVARPKRDGRFGLGAGAIPRRRRARRGLGRYVWPGRPGEMAALALLAWSVDGLRILYL